VIDTHCHLDLAAFDPDRDQVLADARAAGVEAIVIPGVTSARWQGLLAFCDRHDDCFPALGLHPMFMASHQADDLDHLRRTLEEQAPVAVGEIGLDFHDADTAEHERQIQLCAAQLAIARDVGLPVLLHVRKAHDAMLRLLDDLRVTGGIAHAFNGSHEQAQRYIDHGFCLGFGGMLTYARSTRLRRLARELPLDAIVLETDAPDLTVASHRYQRNSPAYLPEVLQALAFVRDADPLEIEACTSANARALLGLPATRH
jgi:TatD DNase family protein